MAEQSFKVDGGIEATGIVTASTFKKPGGTSTQFLKADGSVDSRSFSTSDTTYDITANDTGVANRKYIRLTNSGAGTTDVVLRGGSNVTINRANNELEIASSYTDTDTTYALSAINDGSNKSIVLTAGGSGSGISSISLLPGSNVSLTRSNNDITINSTTYNIQDGQFSQNNFTNALKTKLDGINNDPTYNSLVVTGVTTFNQDVNFPGALYNIHWDQPTSKFKFDDNAQCVFGSATGGDLRIFHAGGHSTIKNETGQFRLAGNDIRLQNQNNSEDYILCTDGADVKLFFNDNEKVATTNWGTKITGVATITQGVNVGGALTVTGDTTIAGNLIVNGTQTIINSNSLEIGDSQILLNRDETGAPSQNAGIIVERGTSTNVSLRWAEGTDTWEYTNDGSTYKTIGSSSISAADGDLTSEEKIRLTDPNGGIDDVVLAAGNGLSIARSGDKITFTNSATDSDTTYSQSCVDSSNDVILRLTAGGSGSGDDDIKIKAGNNITLTHDNASEFTIAGVDAFPSGGIIMWSGAENAIPSGWVLCNGLNSTPDLRNRFIVGSGDGSNYSFGDTGGWTDSIVVDHTHDLNHNHTYSSSTSSDGDHSHTWQRQDAQNDQGYRPWPASNNDVVMTNVQTSTDGAHAHSFSGTTAAFNGASQSTGGGSPFNNRPPYYALCYIMKD